MALKLAKHGGIMVLWDMNTKGNLMTRNFTLYKQLWYKYELSVFIKKSLYRPENYIIADGLGFLSKQGRKRPLDTPKSMIERREREGGGRCTVSSLRGKSSEIMSGNYH